MSAAVHAEPEPEFLTLREAAALLRCHPDTVRAGIRRGEVRAVRIGRTVRVPRAGLLARSAPEPEAVILEGAA